MYVCTIYSLIANLRNCSTNPLSMKDVFHVAKHMSLTTNDVHCLPAPLHTHTSPHTFSTPTPPTCTPTHVQVTPTTFLSYLGSVGLHLVQGEKLIEAAHILHHLLGRPSQQKVFLSTNDIHSLPFSRFAVGSIALLNQDRNQLAWRGHITKGQGCL